MTSKSSSSNEASKASSAPAPAPAPVSASTAPQHSDSLAVPAVGMSFADRVKASSAKQSNNTPATEQHPSTSSSAPCTVAQTSTNENDVSSAPSVAVPISSSTASTATNSPALESASASPMCSSDKLSPPFPTSSINSRTTSPGLSSRAKPFVHSSEESDESPPKGVRILKKPSPGPTNRMNGNGHWKRPSPNFGSRSLFRPENGFSVPSMNGAAYGHPPLHTDSPPQLFQRLGMRRESLEEINMMSSPGPSPGLSIRRLAEQFLSSLPDESPSLRVRKMGERIPNGSTSTTPSILEEGENPERTPDSLTDEQQWNLLHEEIDQFGKICQLDQQNAMQLREELVNRTRWSIRCVWPTAEVDLVGSVAANVALPKSDLDFVIYFPPSTQPPPCYSYATTTQPQATSYTYTAAIQTTETAGSTSTTAGPIVKEGVAPETGDGNGPVVQHFAHAGTLIKLIGGRKKSKLLFRSTKIQVFKDINLIRLRDGCSGISMDLWFPVDPHVASRSQRHTSLIRSFLTDYTALYPLACVIKTFMQQNLLNSGYSGLGSYGVLLMIIRFLQHSRLEAKNAGIPEETSMARLLVEFFRFYVTFDYANKAISVSPENGEWIDKPPVLIAQKRVKKPKKLLDETHDDSDEEHEGEVGVESDSDDEPIITESASAKKKRALANDKFTLLIQDPQDETNQIICHHKALANMVNAFAKACSILDPSTPPPPIPEQATTTNTTPANATPVGPTPISNSAPTSAQTSPAITPLPAPSSIPTFPSISPAQTPALALAALTAREKNPHLSRFHRLIDVEQARQGPAMKACPSSACTKPDGMPLTFCPVQNKVCFACGYLFVKPGTGSKGSKSSNSTPNKNKSPPVGSTNGTPYQHQHQHQHQHQRKSSQRSGGPRGYAYMDTSMMNNLAPTMMQNYVPTMSYYPQNMYMYQPMYGTTSPAGAATSPALMAQVGNYIVSYDVNGQPVYLNNDMVFGGIYDPTMDPNAYANYALPTRALGYDQLSRPSYTRSISAPVTNLSPAGAPANMTGTPMRKQRGKYRPGTQMGNYSMENNYMAANYAGYGYATAPAAY